MKARPYSKFIAVTVLAGCALAAHATLTWNFTSIYTGGNPGVAAPWFTLTIANGANSGDVNFTLTNDLPTSGIGASEFPSVLDLYSSIDPKNISLLAGSSVVSGIGKATGPDHDMNLEVSFPNGKDHLIPPTGASWTLHGTGLNEGSFVGKDPSAVLHIQGLPDANGGSTWAKPGAVPEPASLAALAIGAVALLRKRKK